MKPLVHALSFDVEDFANGVVLMSGGRIVPPTEAVMSLTDKVLQLLDDFDVRATFFVLGNVAESFPELVTRIAAAGHELGIHGWHHHRVFQLSPAGYRESLDRAKGVVESITGSPVAGYRAVAMSITEETLWAYDVLAELGFTYSSSVYPFKGSRYGVPDAPTGPYRVASAAGSILEIPLSVLELGRFRIPVLGGGYLRHFPFAFSSWALRRLEQERRSAVVYMHPYEFDTTSKNDQLPTAADADEEKKMSRFARGQYRNRRHSEEKLRTMLTRHSFAPLCEVYAAELKACTAPNSEAGF